MEYVRAMTHTPTPGREPVSFLVLSGSARADSLNTRLARLAADAIGAGGGAVDFATVGDFDMPGYDGDDEAHGGLPPAAEALRQRLLGSDAFLLVSPEYNAAMPGVVKNAIDWVSRFRPQPFNERHALLASASPSMVGGNRGLWSLRVPLEHLGARVYPDMFSLAQAHNAFGPDGKLADARLQERFERTLGAFMDLVEASKHYRCAKKRWVEFLGERPEPIIDRVE